MSWLDAILLALLAVAVFTGFRRGFVLEILSYGGLLFGLVIGAIFAPGISGLFSRGAPTTRALMTILPFFGTGLLFQTAGFLIGAYLRKSMRRSGVARRLDSTGGAALSLAATLAGIWFLGVSLSQGPSPAVAAAIRHSAVLRAVDRIAPAPPDLFAALKKFLDTTGFPEVFAGISPRLAPPVGRPDPAILETPGVARAATSTVKVLGEACDHIQEGSGFVAAPGLVVTNAHVVAGMTEPRVQPPDGKSNLAAIPVAYDPDRDLAVLRVTALEAEPLEMIEADAERGTPAVVLGYPEHGPFTAEAAAIRARVQAIGHDIYYERTVERRIYVVDAAVRPGNSGGPVVGTDGRVIGVVFAASVGESHTGYALTDDEVRPVLEGASGNEVGTGPCRV